MLKVFRVFQDLKKFFWIICRHLVLTALPFNLLLHLHLLLQIANVFIYGNGLFLKCFYLWKWIIFRHYFSIYFASNVSLQFPLHWIYFGQVMYMPFPSLKYFEIETKWVFSSSCFLYVLFVCLLWFCYHRNLMMRNSV